MVLRKIFGEPLVQFLVLGVAVFGVYTATNGRAPIEDKQVIEVGKGQLAQIFQTFSRTWQRPPTEAEYQGLIDGFVKEEVFYREGQKMGLDQDDTVIRRRMQQKMEFLLEPSAEELTPKPGELEAYFQRHEEKYRRPGQLAFGQIFFKSANGGDKGELSAKSALTQLTANLSMDVSALGDPTMLPARVELTDADVLVASFGNEFVDDALAASEGKWAGPFRSPYGVHLILVEQKIVPGPQPLSEIKVRVQADWENEKRLRIADKRYADMKRLYEVKIILPTDMAASTIKISGVK